MDNNENHERIALHGQRVLFEDNLIDSTILMEQGKITGIESGKKAPPHFKMESVGNHVIMPGLIDAHVHLNEPGRTHWEGFDTGTKAAAAGGITTLIEMPLNSSPVTINSTTFRQKLDAAKGRIHINCGFWGGVVPYNISGMEDFLDSGIWGLKAFLTHSGIDEFPNVDENHLRKVLPILKKRNLPLLVHCELDSPHEGEAILADQPASYEAYLKSRPRNWEDQAIALMIRLCKEFETPVHIVHLSSSDSIPQLTTAKLEGLPLTIETCPHYLYFEAENIDDGATAFKCAPPIREAGNNEKLWQAVKDGLIDFIVSDHSPAPPELKELESGNFKKAWGGIAGLQFGLPAVWTKAKQRDISIEKIAQLMSENVAEFLNIKSKGKIAIGYDADLVVWSPEEQFTVKTELIQHRHKVTPYAGHTLFGRVKQTYINGNLIFNNNQFPNSLQGKILLRKK